MTDHTGMADNTPDAPASTPDYELADDLALADPAQYAALFEDTRQQIASLLLERAATTTEIAAALDRPKGTIGHHLKVMEDAGLVRVVRTKKVRALEAKYYGRTARVFMFRHQFEAVGQPQRLLSRAASEIAQVPAVEEGASPDVADEQITAGNMRYARIPHDRAHEWATRMDDLMLEFSRTPTGGSTTYALVYGLYPTTRGALPPNDSSGAVGQRSRRTTGGEDA